MLCDCLSAVSEVSIGSGSPPDWAGATDGRSLVLAVVGAGGADDEADDATGVEAAKGLSGGCVVEPPEVVDDPAAPVAR